MDMEILKKAQANLEEKDIYTKIENETLYVYAQDVLLELAEFEISYQANELLFNQNK
tara:strand:- start:833 stop:1003 length:171 start_codon:yes stop_codon:yes gene_type:complete